MSNPTSYNPAYQHPKLSATKYPLPTPPPVNVPPVGPASAPPAAPVSPNAAAPWPPAGFDMSSTNFVARVFPCAGGNSVGPSEVPATQIYGPEEARYAAVTARFLNGPPNPLDKK